MKRHLSGTLAATLVLSLAVWGSGGDDADDTAGDTQTAQGDVPGVEDIPAEDAPGIPDTEVTSDSSVDDTWVEETTPSVEVHVDLYVPVGDNYPPPPFGKTVGGVVKNHTFWDPEMDKQMKLAHMYQHNRKRILLVNASAGWCAYCRQEAYELRAVYAEYGPKGLEIWFTLFQDYDGGAPTKAFWDKWMNAIKPTYPTLLDTAFEMGAYFNVDATPMNMILDLNTMKIVYLQTGYDKVGLTNKIKQLLQ